MELSEQQKDEVNRIRNASSLGGLNFLIELELRLFANRTDILAQFTHETSLRLEVEFFQYLSTRITEEQKNIITEAREFRNKLLHSNWWKTCADEDFKNAVTATKNALDIVLNLTGLTPLSMREDYPYELDLSSLNKVEQAVLGLYRDVAIAATAFEITLRNCASLHPDMLHEAWSESKTLEDIQIFLSEKLKFTPDTQALLDNSRKARNKMLHCDFYAAKKMAQAIAPTEVKKSGDVFVIDLKNNFEVSTVAESTRKAARTYGWALEGLTSGAAKTTYEALMELSKQFYFKKFKSVAPTDNFS